ncbi:hypothetical protein [Smaragdicoccus niigatensis]|nr:hypothetical protein [Smaragdicoccus niigatensis]
MTIPAWPFRDLRVRGEDFDLRLEPERVPEYVTNLTTEDAATHSD